MRSKQYTFFDGLLSRLKQMTPEEKLRISFDQREFIMKLYNKGRKNAK